MVERGIAIVESRAHFLGVLATSGRTRAQMSFARRRCIGMELRTSAESWVENEHASKNSGSVRFLGPSACGGCWRNTIRTHADARWLRARALSASAMSAGAGDGTQRARERGRTTKRRARRWDLHTKGLCREGGSVSMGVHTYTVRTCLVDCLSGRQHGQIADLGGAGRESRVGVVGRCGCGCGVGGVTNYWHSGSPSEAIT
ncbi:hypothetical protein C8F04DRAFT_1112665 [Mycena alexandri]|uniref:Uncharacterized protein n=1 Tax=Mycena alexandri TaxID=1745969 RepID=A0AAD6SQX5_9AGAR|nr:hypothetical protein C8F04DRAFT_1112665 [Mycena alexandri]